MERIYLETIINAPIERVFDLSRSIDLHTLSALETNEKAIAGKTSGLIEEGEFVTWRAKHLGIYQHLTVKITKLERPYLLEDKMLKGAFSKMQHRHKFESFGDQTKMIDIFAFQSPFGIIGKFVNKLFLKKYMTDFLITRNMEIKKVAEGDMWRQLL